MPLDRQVPFTVAFPADSLSLMGTLQPGATTLSGDQTVMAGGVPPRMYAVRYLLTK